MMLKNVLCHLRDILLLPCSVVIVIPLLIYASTYHIIPGFLSIRILALTLSIPGLALFAWTNYLFQLIAKGTLAPCSEKQKLVFAGPYKYYRNPMICAILLTQNKETIENNSKIIQLTSILIALEKEALELNGVSKPHPNHGWNVKPSFLARALRKFNGGLDPDGSRDQEPRME